MRIKEVIKEKGTSVKELAEKLGVKPPSLSRAINGNTTVDMLNRIADALGVTAAELLEEKKTRATCPYCGSPIKIEKAE